MYLYTWTQKNVRQARTPTLLAVANVYTVCGKRTQNEINHSRDQRHIWDGLLVGEYSYLARNAHEHINWRWSTRSFALNT